MVDGAAQAPDGSGDRLHRAVFEAAPVGLAVLSPDGETLLDANPSLCRLLGHEPGALCRSPVTALVGERNVSLASGIRRWRRVDGSEIDLRVTIASAPDAGPELVAVVERVDTDELARAEQNRDALVAAGLGEWRWDAGNGQISLSRRAGQILGYPAGRSASWATMRERVDPDDLAAIRAKVADAIAKRDGYEFETRFHRGSDGQDIWISARGQPVFATDGALSGMVGVVQDSTQRVKARQDLSDSEERFRAATQLAALGIFEWNLLDDSAIWENQRMFEIFGRKPDEGTIGKGEFLSEILHPDDRRGIRNAIARALRDDTVLVVSARVRRGGDDAWRAIEMAGRFERDKPGRLPRRLIGVVADVTERRQALERQSLLIRELHHRVKNTLATVQAIVGSTARNASSIDSFYEDFVGRIKSLSHTHSVLTEDTWQTASLRDLLANEFKPYADNDDDEEGPLQDRVTLEGPSVDLPSEIAVPIGMAIHELATNAAKHGALSNRSGRISVSWQIVEGGEAGILLFDWRESEGPEVKVPSRQGFGSRLLQRVLTTQVQAEVRADYAPEGFRLAMRAPMPSRNAALNPLA